MLSSILFSFSNLIVSHMLQSILLLGVLLPLITIFYRLYISPLSSISGPKLAAITRLYIFYQAYIGKRSEHIAYLHSIYGPIVRIAPNEVSFTSATAVKEIYVGTALQPAFPKTSTYTLLNFVGHASVYTTTNREDHAWRQRITGNAYTASHLLTREGKDGDIWSTVGAYMDYVEREGVQSQSPTSKGKTLDIYKANLYFALDSISANLFSNKISTKTLSEANENQRGIVSEICAEFEESKLIVYLSNDFGVLFDMHLYLKDFVQSINSTLRGKRLINLRSVCDESKISNYMYKSIMKVKQNISMSDEADCVAERIVRNMEPESIEKGERSSGPYYSELSATSEVMVSCTK